MTPDEVVAELLGGDPTRPSIAVSPSEPGFYAWWCDSDALGAAHPALPFEPRPPVDERWSLLYVGISPNGPTSKRDLAARFRKDHTGGTIGNSTVRQSLASLLIDSLGLQPLAGYDRSRLVDERPLSNWMDQSCGVTFCAVDRPWTLERNVIARLSPPLNLQHGVHPFRAAVSDKRSALRSACGVR